MADADDTDWLDGPPRLSKRELADLSGLAPAKIDALVRAGMPARPGTSRRAGYSFDLKEIFPWLVANGQEDALAAARQRKVEAEAEKIEQANLKAAGELVSIVEVRSEIADGISALRSHLLAIPSRLVDQSEEVKAAVRQEIVASINAMSFTHGGDDAAP